MLLSRRRLLLSAAGLGLSGVPACSSGSSGTLPTSSARRGLAVEGERRALDALPPYAPHQLRGVRDKLATLVTRRGQPKAGEWLHSHPERGQSFDEYSKSQPTVPTDARRTLVVLPFGDLSPVLRIGA